jgi:hypothetical protein
MGKRQEKRENIAAKLKELRAQQEAILAEIAGEFTDEKYRRLSCVNHRIRTLKERESGGWKRTLPLSSIKIAQ